VDYAYRVSGETHQTRYDIRNAKRVPFLVRGHMDYRSFILCLTMILVSGCQYPFEFISAGEMRQEVLDDDPAFAEILQKKTGLDEEITSLNSGQALKAREIESELSTLKRELQLSGQHTARRIASLDSQLDADRSDIKQRIMEFSTEIRLKRSSLSAVHKMIADLDKLSKQQPAQEAVTEDSLRLRDKIDYQRHQADILKHDIEELGKKIRLLRFKLRLLR
jgi:DNA repair exonuclease SbcCD ATPase subunit